MSKRFQYPLTDKNLERLRNTNIKEEKALEDFIEILAFESFFEDQDKVLLDE